MPTKANIRYDRNGDFEEILQVQDAGTRAGVDLTGDGFELVLWNPADDGDPDHTFRSIDGYIDATDHANGKITIDLPPNAVAAGTYSYHLVKTDADRTVLAFGTFVSHEGVSQPVAMLNSGTQGLRALFDRGLVRQIDLTTPANDFYGAPADFFTYASPSTKYIRTRAGMLEGSTAIRCEFDATGNPLGVRHEPARTNLCTRSQTLNTGWAGSGLTVAEDQWMSPEGDKTVDTITEDTSTNFHYRYTVFTVASAVAHTKSCWISKRSTEKQLQVGMYNSTDGNFAYVRFDATTGVVASSVGDDYAIEEYPDAWKVTCTGTPTITGSHQFRIMLGNGLSYAGDGVTVVGAWGMQAEEGPTASSLIKTDGATATRLVDKIHCTYPFDDTIICGLVKWRVDNYATTAVAASMANDAAPGTANHWYLNSPSNETFRFQLVATSGGVTQTTMAKGSSNQDGLISVAFRLKLDDTAGSVDGETVITDTSLTMPAATMDRLAIGSMSYSLGQNSLNGHIQEVSLGLDDLSNAVLEALAA